MYKIPNQLECPVCRQKSMKRFEELPKNRLIVQFIELNSPNHPVPNISNNSDRNYQPAPPLPSWPDSTQSFMLPLSFFVLPELWPVPKRLIIISSTLLPKSSFISSFCSFILLSKLVPTKSMSSSPPLSPRTFDLLLDDSRPRLSRICFYAIAYVNNCWPLHLYLLIY